MYQLNPVLRDFWRQRKRYKILYGGRASSKCLAAGTKVVMFDGSLKKVEEVVRGDKLMGIDSTSRTVLKTHSGKEVLYHVHQTHGNSYKVTGNHILAVKTRLDDRPIEIATEKFWGYVRSHQLRFYGYKAGVVEYPQKPLRIDPYLMGVILSNESQDLTKICMEEDELINFDLFKNFALEHDLAFYVYRKKNNRLNKDWIYHICAKKNDEEDYFLKVLKRYGIFNDETFNRTLPIEYIINSEQNRLELLAAFIDNRGGFCVASNRIYIRVKDFALASGLKRICDSLGFDSIFNSNNGDKNGKLMIRGDFAKLALRKKIWPKDFLIEGKETHNILSIEKLYAKEDFFGFTLDKDQLFLLEDYTVTHNSHDAAGMAVYLAANYKLKFLCVRQYQNKISESVYTLLKDKIEDSEYAREFKITEKGISHRLTDSRFLFYGIARNLDEIKSTEGINILWIEEAHALTATQWATIEPTIRNEDTEIWIVFNPNEESDFVYQNFVARPMENSIVRKINYDENCFLSNTMKDVIKEAKIRDPKSFKHIYEGYPKTGSDLSVINRLYIRAALNLHKHPELGWEVTGKNRIGYDVADDGEDVNATAHAKGNVLFKIETWEGGEDELLKSSGKVHRMAIEENAEITYDSIGVGAFVGSHLKELNDDNYLSIKYNAFNANTRVNNPDDVFIELPHVEILNKDHFSNIKAQVWTEIAERFRKTYEYANGEANHYVEDLISIDTDGWSEEEVNDFVMELSQPRKDSDSRGKFKVESKKDMRKRQVKSPNKADAAIMCLMQPITAPAGFLSNYL